MKIIKICIFFFASELQFELNSFQLIFNCIRIKCFSRSCVCMEQAGSNVVRSRSDSGSIIHSVRERTTQNDLKTYNVIATSDPRLSMLMLKHYTPLGEIIAPIEWKVKRFHVLAMIIFIELVKWIFPQHLPFLWFNFAPTSI